VGAFTRLGHEFESRGRHPAAPTLEIVANPLSLKQNLAVAVTGAVATEPLEIQSEEPAMRFSRAPHLALTAVVLLFVMLASVVALKTQIYDASDEPGHVENIETLAGGHWYGFDEHCRSAYGSNEADALMSCSGDEAHQAPLYYMLMAGWQDAAGFSVHALSKNWDVLISQREIAVDRGLVLWLRFGNILLGAATVVVTFFAARVITRDRWTPVIAAAAVAFLPAFIFRAAYVNNDNLVNLLGALLTLCALEFMRHRTASWIVVTGVTYGLMVTTKISTIPIGLIVPVLALFAPTWRRRVFLFLCGALSALAVSAWYLVQNWVRYGDPLALRASRIYLEHVGGFGTRVGVPYVIRDPVGLVFYDVPKRVITTFWYSAGWSVSTTTRMGAAIACVVAILLLGLFRQSLPKRPLLILTVIAVLSFGCVWAESLQTASYASRVALVGVSAMGIIMALALQRWSLLLRWLLPAAELIGFLAALYHDWILTGWARL
jgi:hypothetical protein